MAGEEGSLAAGGRMSFSFFVLVVVAAGDVACFVAMFVATIFAVDFGLGVAALGREAMDFLAFLGVVASSSVFFRLRTGSGGAPVTFKVWCRW